MDESGKAMVFSKIGEPLLLKEFKLPKLKKGEVLVKIKNCTLCKSDLHTFLGRRPGPTPSVLGHEIVGEIYDLPTHEEALDYNGAQLQKGDLITWALAVSCGKCNHCQKGFPQKCDQLQKYGHLPIHEGHQFNGGLAEFIHLKNGTTIFKLKPEIPTAFLSPLNCSFATVKAALRISGSIENKNVFVFGAGMLGVLAVAMLQEKGTNKITIVDPSSYRLGIAEKFGADKILQWKKNEATIEKFVKEQLNNEKFDIILETSGSSKAIDASIQIMDVGAQLILVGSVFPVKDFQINAEKILRNLWQIKGVHNYHPDDLKDAIEFYYKNYSNYPFELLFHKKEFSLEDSEKAIKFAEDSKTHRIIIKNSLS